MDKMLTKFESKSNRVKGLSFHPVRPWILASLHNGQIQLWDYRMGTLLDKFEEHDGPVRGVDFHRTQSLIVSGGDDYKVKVWDYKLKRCLFTLLGHLDYIRTVQFHVEYPWIVSASDDQTIRIWNWQSRTCISVLTGHNHYVMCASFHPRDDMIVSASLDQTVRVWDTTGLRKKTVRGAPPQMDDMNVVSKVNNELFGGNDAVVKYVLEGHERGVNWASFHPTLPLIISGADDRQVKLWRMNETKAWEVDTMRGHTNNVSCVLFHPKHELIISNSEDRTIRVWDISKRLGVQTFRRESDRFWILAAHPDQNLLAAGHDSGMTVFKLERERPAFESFHGKCYYVKDRYLRSFEYNNGRDVPLVSLRRANTSSTVGIGGGPRTLQYNTLNKSEHNVLVLSDTEGGSYELMSFSGDSGASTEGQDIRRGMALSAAFVARDRFAILDKTKQLLIKNFQNEVVRKVVTPVNGVEQIFPAGTAGRVLLKTEDRIVLFDFQARKVLAELFISRVKYVIWNSDCSSVAFLSKHQLTLANKQLEQYCTINETLRLKGGCWDDSGSIFVFATSNHIKYALLNGDKGIIRGLEAPVYPTKLYGNNLFCLDREGKMRTIELELAEPLFKLALEKKDYGTVMKMVKQSRLCGQSIITYLQEKGYPEVALHFVHDARTRFKLALACGSIQVALSVAQELDDAAWIQLGAAALRMGKFEIVEMAYQKTKQFDQLSFLYLITGNTEKLRKMLKIAELRKDVMSVVHNSLYLGEAEQRIQVLEATGLTALAIVLATTHNLECKSLQHASKFNLNLSGQGNLLLPPTPILKGDDWPTLTIPGPSHDRDAGNAKSRVGAMDDDEEVAAGGDGGWGDDDMFDEEDEGTARKPTAAQESNGWENDDLDLSDDDEPVATPSKGKGGGAEFDVNVPTTGNSPIISWCSESTHCADHFAAGAVESAVTLLNRQIAANSVRKLKSGAGSLFVASRAYLKSSFTGHSRRQFLIRPNQKGLPNLSLKTPNLLEKLKAAYKAFTGAQFQACQELLESILSSVPLTVAQHKGESDDLKELLNLAKEYLVAVKLKTAMDNASADPVRSLELAAYFTHCNLQPAHMILALKTAMATAFKNKNYVNACSFARRLLDFPELSTEKQAELKSKALKVLQKSEQQGRNEVEIDYDERNPFSIDCDKFKPLYRGSPLVNCPYCGSSYSPSFKGQLCKLCEISAVGTETIGLVTMSAYRKK
jgi:coatomer protein complex subunit alpha (xenin)